MCTKLTHGRFEETKILIRTQDAKQSPGYHNKVRAQTKVKVALWTKTHEDPWNILIAKNLDKK